MEITNNNNNLTELSESLEKDVFNIIKDIFGNNTEINEVTKIYFIGRSLARLQKDNCDIIGCLRMIINSFNDEVIFMQENLDHEKKALDNSVNKFIHSLDTKTTYKIN